MEEKCKYCGKKLPKYHKICPDCYAKLKRVRELRQLLLYIKEQEQNNRVIVDGAYYCPRCKSILHISDHVPKYCSECGLKLLWR